MKKLQFGHGARQSTQPHSHHQSPRWQSWAAIGVFLATFSPLAFAKGKSEEELTRDQARIELRIQQQKLTQMEAELTSAIVQARGRLDEITNRMVIVIGSGTGRKEATANPDEIKALCQAFASSNRSLASIEGAHLPPVSPEGGKESLIAWLSDLWQPSNDSAYMRKVPGVRSGYITANMLIEAKTRVEAIPVPDSNIAVLQAKNTLLQKLDVLIRALQSFDAHWHKSGSEEYPVLLEGDNEADNLFTVIGRSNATLAEFGYRPLVGVQTDIPMSQRIIELDRLLGESWVVRDSARPVSGLILRDAAGITPDSLVVLGNRLGAVTEAYIR
jgi:hypothetical protein